MRFDWPIRMFALHGAHGAGCRRVCVAYAAEHLDGAVIVLLAERGEARGQFGFGAVQWL